jgi:hypothetical protein
MLAEIFMLRVEANARRSQEPNPARFAELNPAGSPNEPESRGAKGHNINAREKRRRPNDEYYYL